MPKKAVFYHAGCPVCVSAEQEVLDIIDKKACNLEVVHFGKDKNRIAEAEKAAGHLPAVHAVGGSDNAARADEEAAADEVATGVEQRADLPTLGGRCPSQDPLACQGSAADEGHRE